MQEVKKIDISKIDTKVQNIGVEIMLVESLVNFLNLGISQQELLMKKTDIENLVLVIKEKIEEIKINQDKIEQVLDI